MTFGPPLLRALHAAFESARPSPSVRALDPRAQGQHARLDDVAGWAPPFSQCSSGTTGQRPGPDLRPLPWRIPTLIPQP
eukprot:349875-Chlamydomonas_euryale.AAC.5